MSSLETAVEEAKQALSSTPKPMIRIATLRASQNEFRMGKLAVAFAKLMVTEVVAITQSESDGFISICLLYR